MNPRTYRSMNKWAFRTLDVLVVLAVLFNFGAFMITNALVVKVGAEQGKTIVMEEGSPVTAVAHGFATSMVAIFSFGMLLIPLTIRALMLWWYVRSRNQIYTDEGYFALLGLVVLVLYILTWDFVNDLGYYIGMRYLI